MKKKIGLIGLMGLIMSAGIALKVARAQVSAPPLPDTSNIEREGSDALSKLLNSVSSYQGIKSSLKSVTSRVSQGRGILDSIRNAWVSVNQWFEEKIGISLRTIIQFVGYIFIFIAVLWIKIIRWFLGII